MQEGATEWLVNDKANMEYHTKQFENPYRSTIHFVDFLNSNIGKWKGKNVYDFGCGQGASFSYILQNLTVDDITGVGIDFNRENVELGNAMLVERGINNVRLTYENFFNASAIVEKGGGIISLQVLSIMPEYKSMCRAMLECNPDWIAFSTLGFEGMIDYTIRLTDYTKVKNEKPADVFYNIYSLPIMKEFFIESGYKNVVIKQFEMDIDIPKSNKMGRGTYTVKDETGKRMQISGALLMPWYFVFASKEKL